MLAAAVHAGEARFAPAPAPVPTPRTLCAAAAYPSTDTDNGPRTRLTAPGDWRIALAATPLIAAPGGAPTAAVIVVGSDADPRWALPAGAYAARTGTSVLFVSPEGVPAPTIAALERYGGRARIYVLGPAAAVPDVILEQLGRHSRVTRIAGRDFARNAVAFAEFRRRWMGASSRDFGWGLAEARHNFTFANPDDWQIAVTGSLLSHMGKHGPMLLLPDGTLPEATVRYLASVRPAAGAVNDPLINHGWILGTPAHVPPAVQGQIDALLEAGTTPPCVHVARRDVARSSRECSRWGS